MCFIYFYKDRPFGLLAFWPKTAYTTRFSLLCLQYTPKRAFYQTTNGDGFVKGVFKKMDLRGIEPLPLQCECSVVPLNYRPFSILFQHFILNRDAGNRSQIPALRGSRPRLGCLASSAYLRLSIPDAGKAVCLLIPHFIRDAGNRTRTTESRTPRTATILHPVKF